MRVMATREEVKMINRITESSLKLPGLVIILLLGVIGFGIYEYTSLPIDAFPDISPVMVPVFAEAHGLAPEEVERLITYPIESAMNGLPDVTEIKSTSGFGMAVIYVYFKDSVDIYFARQLVAERLDSATAELPKMHELPSLGPISTGLGQIFIYYLEADEQTVDTEGKPLDLWLRELNDWVVKYQLQMVPGVTDVLSVGGHVLQYQIRIDPYALRKYMLTMNDVVEAVRTNNRNVGGQFIVSGSEEHLVRGIGLVTGLDDIRSIAVKETNGVPVLIGDVGEVAYGNQIRRGVVTHNGEKEVVSGIVMKLYGENTSEVISRLYLKVEEIKKTLPDGVRLIPYYEQAELVRKATATVKNALLTGGILVILILFFFLRNWRLAFIVALSLPVCGLFAIIFMGFYGVSANLMSLGGIAVAIGMLGDGSIVIVENIYRHLARGARKKQNKREIVMNAVREVNRPVLFSVVIIMLVFLPIFTLTGIEGKMFAPLAFTITFSLLGSIFMALIISPVLSLLMVPREIKSRDRVISWLRQKYGKILNLACDCSRMVINGAVIVLILTLIGFSFLGTEFIPTLEEGSIFIGVNMAPSISLEEATAKIMSMEKILMTFHEVKEVVSRIGRPEAGSHPHPVNYAEVHIELKPEGEWKDYDTKEELIEAMNTRLDAITGTQKNFTQPIQNAFDELLSGVKTELAIKIYGEDLDRLRSLATQVKNKISGVPGLVDLSVEQSYGQPQVQVIADRASCARYGISISDVMETVELAVGGEVIDSVYLNTRRFGIHVRYQEKYRKDISAISNILIDSKTGVVPLDQVAEIKEVTGPIQINREKNQRRWTVQGNIRGRDIGSVVADIKERVEGKLDLPPGYSIEYGGQFENQQRAMLRLMIIVPVVLLMVLFMLWMTFSKLRHALIILSSIPLALVGGVLGLLISGEYLSVPASVGFIALFGIAVQNGMVLVSYFNQLRDNGKGIRDAVEEGAMLRLRPVLMTAMTTVLGLTPLLLSTGIGSEVQRPLASVVIFGLITSTLLTLLVIPVIYIWIESKRSDS